ncbi:MAG: hypothetical protein R3B49_04875 [Phycisphaerales bacterium]
MPPSTPTPPARVVLVTIPKAGTYLFSETIRRLGFEQTHLHLAPDRVVAYDPARLDEGRAHPERFQVDCRIEQSTRLVRAGQFAASHLPCNERTLAALEDCRVIFATRELRSSLVSRARFDTKTGRFPNPEGVADPSRLVAAYLGRYAPARFEAPAPSSDGSRTSACSPSGSRTCRARHLGHRRDARAPGPALLRRTRRRHHRGCRGRNADDARGPPPTSTPSGPTMPKPASQQFGGPGLNDRFGYPSPPGVPPRWRDA